MSDPSDNGDEIVPFVGADGTRCNLVHVRSPVPPTRPPVLLVHGAGVRANIFRAPVETTLVDRLVSEGYDVWLENWRASIEFPPNLWTLDQAALYDHPAAVRTIVERTGVPRIRAVVHCQGSTSFVMSAVAGHLPAVETIVSNAVSLHPVVPTWSRMKLSAAVPLISLITPYLDPSWGLRAPTFVAKAISALVALTHRECNNAVCKQVSFTYGSGFPALWRHENLNDATHEWLKHEFAAVPMRFFRQMARSVRRGAMVSVEGLPGLPANFAEAAPKTEARFAFIAGEKNLCFLAESQRRTHAWFEKREPGRHSLHVFPEYGHLDVFMGQRAATDTFPTILAELDRGP